MGFSGGGANVTKAHQHDGTVVQDGGALDFNNVTQASLAAGDLTYSDGSALQVLGIGAATETLVVNGAATAPEWSAPAGGGSMVLQEEFILGADTSDWNETLASAITYTSVSDIIIYMQGQLINGVGNATFSWIYNGYGSSVSNMYANMRGATGVFGFNSNSAAFIVLDNPTSGIGDDGTLNAEVHLQPNPFTGFGGRRMPFVHYSAGTGIDDMIQYGGGRVEDFTPFDTSLTEITFAVSNGDIAQNSIIRIYSVNA